MTKEETFLPRFEIETTKERIFIVPKNQYLLESYKLVEELSKVLLTLEGNNEIHIKKVTKDEVPPAPKKE
ncbi:MAG: hypothetical protein PVI03_04615 [Candidatus Thorarchaeota archaeon]